MAEFDVPVLETIHRSGLDPSTYMVFGGAVMAMHGIRPAQDVDLMVEPTVFKQMSGDLLTPSGLSLVANFEELDEGEEHRLLSAEKLDDGSLPLDLRGLTKYKLMGTVAFTQWVERGEDLETSLGTVRVMQLEDIFTTKLDSSRPKDRQDAYMIHRHLVRPGQVAT
jgi:hypothetical protein